MTRFAGLLLLAAILCVSSAEKDILELRYPRATLTPPRGSSVKLLCNAIYNYKVCGMLHAVWQLENMQLTERGKYFTTVNETQSDGGVMRRRQVVTEILDLTAEDGGRYQCRAECKESPDAAVGRTIEIEVQG